MPLKRSKNITYSPPNSAENRAEQKLDVAAPRLRNGKKLPVLIFIYGGNWTSGRRGLYSFFGNRMARKHVVTVIPDYPKSPEAQYDEMTMDVAKAVQWVKQNIDKYGGDTGRIFISGHSAGGGLAPLAVLDEHYFDDLKMHDPIKGLILIDPAGIDMYRYMKEVDYGPDSSYLDVFTKDPKNWRDASAMYHLNGRLQPMLIYTGEKTYKSIAVGTQRFVDSVRLNGGTVTYKILKGKHHIPMITQFFKTWNPRFDEITTFMKK